MSNNKRERIIATVLSDAMSSLYEGSDRNDFYPIAHLPLGYGTVGCADSEIDYYDSVATFTKIAREEGSRVFILGFGSRTIPSTWIKTAELIIQGSAVRVVLIPLCRLISEADRLDPILHGTVFYVDRAGMFKAEELGQLRAEAFWAHLIEVARRFDKKFQVAV